MVAAYAYDPFNRLIGRTLDPDGEGGSASLEDTYFVYDGNQIGPWGQSVNSE